MTAEASLPRGEGVTDEAAEQNCKHCGKPIRAAKASDNTVPGWVHTENGQTYCGLYAEPAAAPPATPGARAPHDQP